MSNPVVPWELLLLDPDQDAAKLNQNFAALIEYTQFNLLHTHHIETHTAAIGALVANGTSNHTITFNQTYTTEPYVLVSINSLATSSPVGIGEITAGVWDLSMTDCQVHVRNNSSGTLTASQHYIVATIIDATYDVSGV